MHSSIRLNANTAQERNNKKFTALRAIFMARASAQDIPGNAFKLAYLILFKFMNMRTESVFVGQSRLASELGVTTRSVKKYLAVLRRLGLRIEPGNGRGKASIYWLESDPKRVNAPEAKRGNAEALFRGKKRVNPIQKRKRVNPGSPYLKPWGDIESPQGFGEKLRPASRVLQTPTGGSASDGQPPDFEKRNPREFDFRGLRKIWIRPWIDNDAGLARAAYAQARREVDADTTPPLPQLGSRPQMRRAFSRH